MPRNFFAQTSLLFLTLGAIATSNLLGAGSTSAQSQAQTASPTATDAGTKQMDHGDMNHSSMAHSASMDLGPAKAELDRRFIDAMAPHHQGAVAMAKETQQKAKRPEIQKLAQEIITSQKAEIQQMQQWKQAWYKQ